MSAITQIVVILTITLLVRIITISNIIISSVHVRLPQIPPQARQCWLCPYDNGQTGRGRVPIAPGPLPSPWLNGPGQNPGDQDRQGHDDGDSLCFWLLPLAGFSLRASPVDSLAAPLTYEDTDPVTGEPVRCDACPPGTFLRASCSSATKSECAPCPAGSFTELWNYIRRCLRCGVCGHNQVLKKECTADSDCQCECQQGFYYNAQYNMCVRHSECPPGQGVLSNGTAEKDTECDICSAGTFSDIYSAHSNCTEHKNCRDAGMQMVLRGSTWHDSVCASCGELKDGADYLKEIVLAFFVRHKIDSKRLRRIVLTLPTEGGKKKSGTSQRPLSEVHAQVKAWVSSATAMQIRQLPAILAKRRVKAAGRLQKKLSSIDRALMQTCSLRRY
ncbi:tumor necrosis factor receptor superfamily member 6B-like [Xenentodon cancila]